jgi:hypothetical protein
MLSGHFELGSDGMKWTKLAYLCSVVGSVFYS